MMEWLAMGGYAGYVWGSYGVTAFVIAVELVALARRKQRARERARAELEANHGN